MIASRTHGGIRRAGRRGLVAARGRRSDGQEARSRPQKTIRGVEAADLDENRLLHADWGSGSRRSEWRGLSTWCFTDGCLPAFTQPRKTACKSGFSSKWQGLRRMYSPERAGQPDDRPIRPWEKPVSRAERAHAETRHAHRAGAKQQAGAAGCLTWKTGRGTPMQNEGRPTSASASVETAMCAHAKRRLPWTRHRPGR